MDCDPARSHIFEIFLLLLYPKANKALRYRLMAERYLNPDTAPVGLARNILQDHGTLGRRDGTSTYALSNPIPTSGYEIRAYIQIEIKPSGFH